MDTLIADCRPATAEETLIWRRSQAHADDPGLVLSYRLALAPSVDVELLGDALHQLLAGPFASLRNTFLLRDGTLLSKRLALSPEVLEYGSHAQPLQSLAQNRSRLYRFVLQTMDDGQRYLDCLFSHLVMDGVGVQRFMAALSDCYARVTPAPCPAASPRPPVPPDFWSELLAGYALEQPLPMMPPASGPRSGQVRAVTLAFSQATPDQCSALQTSGFRLTCAAMALTLARYLRAWEQDAKVMLCHTVQVPGGPDAGTCSNLVPLPVDVDACSDARELLQRIGETRRRIRPGQHTPWAELFAQFPVANAGNVVINESPGLLTPSAPRLGEVCEIRALPRPGGPYDLAAVCSMAEGYLQVRLEASHERSTSRWFAQFAEQFQHSLHDLLNDTQRPLAALAPLQRPERGEQGPSIPPISLEQVLCALEQAKADRIALIDDEGELDYGALRSSIDATVTRLGQAGGSQVGICISRNRWLPIAMLAALKQGVRFTPLEASLPDDALSDLVDRTQISYVLCDRSTRARLVHALPQVSLLEVDMQVIPEAVTSPLPSQGIDSIAYQMFSSGSTGIPKGIQIGRKNLAAFLTAMAAMPFCYPGARWLALTPISFDISLLEALLPLCSMGCIVMADDPVRRSGRQLIERLERDRIEILQLTPSSLRLLKDSNWQARRPITLLCGGERLSPELADWVLAAGHTLFHVYGPTEATIWVSCQRVTRGMPLSIGHPLDNTGLQVLDAQLQPLALGVPGELVISGSLVGAGYLPPTQQHSFIELFAEQQTRAYHTGDRAVAWGDQRIDYLGRLDSQVKIRGHRVELSETEVLIRQLAPDVEPCCVVREEPVAYLCAFIRPAQGRPFDVETLRAQIASRLPEHRCPSRYVVVDRWPHTPNGKLDMRRLMHAELSTLARPAPEQETAPGHDSDSQGIAELRRLIVETLGVEVKDPNQSLVAAGIDSIGFNLLAERLQRELAVDIAPHRFYELSSLSAIANALHAETPGTLAHREPSMRPEVAPLAILGMAGIGPAGLNIDELWQAMLEQRNCIAPCVRTDLPSILPGGYLHDIDSFDAAFFGISAVEAAHMDPRQRLLLQECWRTFEDAGLVLDGYRGARVGCYIAATGCEYATVVSARQKTAHAYDMTGTSASILANRLSYQFDWRGPSVTIDSACSSGLTVLARAASDLQQGRCDMAFVGAVNLLIDSRTDEALRAGKFLSPNGVCSPFAEAANGYVRGEGVFAVLLCRLEDRAPGVEPCALLAAVEDGHCGRSASLTAPSASAQADMIASIYRSLGGTACVGFIETHGTGTRLGDPIEAEGISRALVGIQAPGEAPIWLGTSKAAFGHLEAAAGLFGLIKAVKVVAEAVVPANPDRGPDNRLVKFEGAALSNAGNQGWPKRDDTRQAGVSSYGFGGAGAHAVVQNAPSRTTSLEQKPDYAPCLVLLSGFDGPALKRQVQALKAWLVGHPEASLGAIAKTLGLHRTHMASRVAVAVHDLESLRQALDCIIEDRPLPAIEERTLLQAANDYLQGGAPEPSLFDALIAPVRLPTYRFDESHRYPLPAISQLDLKPGKDLPSVLTSCHPVFQDHQVNHQGVLPGVCALHWALRIDHRDTLHRSLVDITWRAPLRRSAADTRLELAHAEDGTFKLLSGETPLVSGMLSIDPQCPAPASQALQRLREAQGHLPTARRIDATRLYAAFDALGIQYSRDFRSVRWVDRQGPLACARLICHGTEPIQQWGLLDGALQSGLALTLESRNTPVLPFTLGALLWSGPLDCPAGNYYALTEKTSDFRTQILLCDDRFQVIAQFVDLGIKPYSGNIVGDAHEPQR
ncbi:MAG TPA: hypothetical protein DCP19_11580 [Pseudomonas sp.]|uniref:beta-ketoacyl synthase N-terminal-like domain-containing protein n=1 Tax=Pseudomonas alabamensis TaxID=3064349 RepID=UPI000EC94614|nr:hypothetical protein [Pseudomonas sp.]